MTCRSCDCLDCNRQRGIDQCMNRSNDMDDEVETSAPPIHRQPVAAIEPATEAQKTVWMGYVHEVYNDHSNVTGLPMSTLLSLVAHKIPGLRVENYTRVTEQIREMLLKSDQFEIRKGKSGGVFRKQFFVGNHAQTGARSDRSVSVPLTYIELTPRNDIPDLITGKLVENCTCKGCGTGLNSSEKSCWKCGAVQ